MYTCSTPHPHPPLPVAGHLAFLSKVADGFAKVFAECREANGKLLADGVDPSPAKAMPPAPADPAEEVAVHMGNLTVGATDAYKPAEWLVGIGALFGVRA